MYGSLNIRSVIIILLFQISVNQELSAQVTYGQTLGNYTGVGGLKLNPSALHNSKAYLDIRIAGLGLFFQNTALYMSKEDYRFSNFFKSGYEWPSHQEEYGTEERIFYHYSNKRNKHGFLNLQIDGPGAMLTWKQHAFGITTAIRSVAALTQIPYEAANFAYLGLNYRPQQNIFYSDNIPFRGNGLAWGELGISYANTFYAQGFNVVSGGITLKRLWGFSGFYSHVGQIDYIVPDDSTIDIKNLRAEFGMALPVDYQTNELSTDKLFKGKGYGFDIGVTYKRLRQYHQNTWYSSLCAQPYEDYIYRVGVALVDFGAIKFKDNAVKMRIEDRSARWENVNDLNFSNINSFLDTVSYMFYGDYTSAYAGESFSIWLPAAVSVQFDYQYRKDFYINTSLVYGLPLTKSTIVRPVELSITPRYETKAIEFSMPVSVYNWQLVRLGAAMRFYGVTIGTDKLGGFFHLSDFTGLDFYISFRFFFNKGNCRLKGPVHCGSEKPNRN